MIKTIYMGQLGTVRSPDVLKTTLGSCVGLVLYDPSTDTFGMAHIMLPIAPKGEADADGKYADTAIPALIEKMGTAPDQVPRLRAKLAGGANMFASLVPGEKDFFQVGERNAKATLDILKAMGIAVLGMQLGGHHGRELSIDAKTGKIWVRTIGSESIEM